MIHAVLKEKAEIKHNEDVKTSSVIGMLSLLPAELFWKLLRSSLSEHCNLPLSSGDIINIAFWPHWYVNSTNVEVTNAKFVEPDVFIEFENFNLVIEVKLDGNLQYEEQWINEICAYQTNFDSDKRLVYIALGGNDSLDPITLTKGRAKGQLVHRCSWQSLLKTIHEEASHLDSEPYKYNCQNLRILRMTEQAFAIYGERVTLWMESIPSEITHVSSNCLNKIRELWKIK